MLAGAGRRRPAATLLLAALPSASEPAPSGARARWRPRGRPSCWAEEPRTCPIRRVRRTRARRSAASPASRSNTNRQPAVPGQAQRPGDQLELTLSQPTNSQRSSSTASSGCRRRPYRDPAPVPDTTPPRYGCAARARSTCSAPTWARPWSSGVAAGRSGRHRRAIDPDLGAGLRLRPGGAERMASQPEAGKCTNTDGRPAGEPQDKLTAGWRTGAATGPRGCSTRRQFARTETLLGGPAPRRVCGEPPGFGSGGRGKDPRRCLIFGQRRRAGDQALELVQRQVRDRLEDLLVGPADLPRLLVQVERGVPSASSAPAGTRAAPPPWGRWS